jgi:glucose/arabinose dehydrogenase
MTLSNRKIILTVCFFAAVFIVLGSFLQCSAQDRALLGTGLANAVAVATSREGKTYVAVEGTQNGAGAVLVLQKDRFVPFADGPKKPRALIAYGQWLFVVEKKRIWRIDRDGKSDIFADVEAIPSEPHSFSALAADSQGGAKGATIFACAVVDAKGNGSAIYRIASPNSVQLLLDRSKLPSLHTPSGIVTDGAGFLLMLDGGSGELHRIRVADASSERIAENLVGCEGLAWDQFGRLFIGDPKGHRLLVIPRPGEKPIAMVNNLKVLPGFCTDQAGSHVLVPNPNSGSLTAVPIAIPGHEVDMRPLAIETEVSFPQLQWSGWKGETDDGRLEMLRPVLLTHAGDGSKRVFVATEQGVVHCFANDQQATKTKVFLDIRDRVRFNEKNADAGFLGLAFHPQFKTNGEFFVYYTSKSAAPTNILARFKLSKDNPDRANPNSEEELMRFPKAEIFHNGGTLCFGRDGYLYIATGDGGPQGDPRDNGQNLTSLLAKILRIDVDQKSGGKNYGIPMDNPFVGRLNARAEVWAYGLRVVWRMAFDRATGQLWAADVGQDRYEEIDIIQRGGNYGWNRREGLHPHGPKGKGPSKEFIDPIWEYRHDLGACVIGGCIYRGKRLPELQGYYVYADYTNSLLWALRYDFAKGRVVENRKIKDRGLPIWSFGEDENGEVYLLCRSIDGRGIFRFVRERGAK